MESVSALSQRLVRVSAVIERDLKKFRRNPVIIAMSLLMPVIYLVILGNSFQGKLIGLPVAVVNQDPGPAARALVDNLRAVQAGPRTVLLSFATDERAAVGEVRSGRYKAALIIPADFSHKVALRTRPTLQLFLDNTDGISMQTLRGVVEGAIGALGVDYVPVREPHDRALLRDVNLFPSVDYYQSLVPGVVIMAIFLGTLTTGVFNVVMDRFLGTEEAYLLTPLTKTDIVGGLVISGLSVTSLVAVLVLMLGMLISGIAAPGSLSQVAAILVVILLTTLSLISLMFVLLGRADHPRIVGVLSGFLNVILFFPSGAVYPLASLPGWLKQLAWVNPEAYAVDALKAVLFKDAGLSQVAGDLGFLVLFASVTMGIAILLLKRRL